MPNQPKTPARTVRIDDELWDAAKAEAKSKGGNVSDVIRAALRKHLGLLLVAFLLAGCGASAQASETHKFTPLAPTPSKFTPDAAREFASITGGNALHRATRWACGQPMHISVAAPGGFEAQAYKSLDYTVTYLQALGYNVGITAPTAYQSDITDAPQVGTVLVVVAPYRQDQPKLGINVGVTIPSGGAVTRSALVVLDGSTDGLDPDVILHEFGHVLGLDHREAGSVMQESWGPNSGHFGADETAAISCR